MHSAPSQPGDLSETNRKSNLVCFLNCGPSKYVSKLKNIMKAVNYHSKALVVLSLIFACGCQENEDAVPGTGEGKIGMAFVLASGDNTAANARIAKNDLEILEGYVQIKELEMELEGRDANGRFEKEYDVRFDQIKKVTFDRVDESSDFFFNIPAAEYKDIEMEIDLIDNKNEPSIYLQAQYEDLAGHTFQ